MPKYSSAFVKNLLSLLIVVSSLYFLGRTLSTNWDQAGVYFVAFNKGYFVIATGFALLGLISILVATWLLFSFIRVLRFADVSKYYVWTALSKYLPGGVWAGVTSIYFFRNLGFSLAQTSAVFVLEQIAIIGSCAVFGAFAIFCYRTQLGSWITVPVLVLILGYSIFMLYPRALARAIEFFQKRIPMLAVYGIEFKDYFDRLTVSRLCLVSFVYLLCWFFFSTGFFILVAQSLPSVTVWDFIKLCGVWPSAWLIGFLSVITPSGLGVREGALFIFLEPFISDPVQRVLITVMARLWSIVADLVSIGFALLYSKLLKTT